MEKKKDDPSKDYIYRDRMERSDKALKRHLDTLKKENKKYKESTERFKKKGKHSDAASRYSSEWLAERAKNEIINNVETPFSEREKRVRKKDLEKSALRNLARSQGKKVHSFVEQKNAIKKLENNLKKGKK